MLALIRALSLILALVPNAIVGMGLLLSFIGLQVGRGRAAGMGWASRTRTSTELSGCGGRG